MIALILQLSYIINISISSISCQDLLYLHSTYRMPSLEETILLNYDGFKKNTLLEILQLHNSDI